MIRINGDTDDVEEVLSSSMMSDQSLLDNPIWNALSTTHSHFSLGNERIKIYQPGILPFMGVPDSVNFLSAELIQSLTTELNKIQNATEELNYYVRKIETDLPIITNIAVMRMICTENSFEKVERENIFKLTTADKDDLFDLVNLQQPGYIERGTYQVGDYYGIRKDGQLVAVAGERMKMTGFTEVSAVCTHPDHTGKGYAQQLVKMVCHEIFRQGRVPFLHVLETNTRAIKIYELLGFRTCGDFPLIKIIIHK